VKAASEAGISNDRIVLIGEERDLGFRHVTDILDETPKGSRTKLEPGKDLAFLVYSSGTTGLPKGEVYSILWLGWCRNEDIMLTRGLVGVMLTHINVVSDLFMVNSSEGTLLKWDKDKILSVLPFYHIYGKIHLLAPNSFSSPPDTRLIHPGLQCLVHFPAYAGLTTIVMSSFDLATFCSLIQDHKITYTYVAPPIILHLAKSPLVSNYDLSSLRTITSGAAPLTKELIYAVKDRLGTEVKQAYGLSETSPVTHIQKAWNHGLGSTGPALPNQIVKFMSPDGEEVPTGREAEVWISGPVSQ
jgi:acyl-CoA synthetase (AMP-forming)/AMP-acid ligase II